MSKSKRKKITSYGCSFTFGEGLGDSKKSYPYELGRLLDDEFDIENNSSVDESNDRIFRTFFEHLITNEQKTIYTIQWTFPDRTEFKNDDIDTEKLLRYIWSIDSLCKQFGHELIQFMPIENKFDVLPDSFLNTKEITTLVENNTQLTEEQHKKLGKYLLIALINVLENKLK